MLLTCRTTEEGTSLQCCSESQTCPGQEVPFPHDRPNRLTARLMGAPLMGGQGLPGYASFRLWKLWNCVEKRLFLGRLCSVEDCEWEEDAAARWSLLIFQCRSRSDNNAKKAPEHNWLYSRETIDEGRAQCGWELSMLIVAGQAADRLWTIVVVLSVTLADFGSRNNEKSVKKLVANWMQKCHFTSQAITSEVSV